MQICSSIFIFILFAKMTVTLILMLTHIGVDAASLGLQILGIFTVENFPWEFFYSTLMLFLLFNERTD